MRRVTQNAPFGTDNTPALAIKIVGGKRVEILARNETESENSQRINGLPYPKGPHGTPSMLTQPIFRTYEFDDLQRGYNTAKQHEIARQITSYTSPFGDRTQSFRHGVIPINKKAVLPPIGASQPAGSTLAKENEFSGTFLTEIDNDEWSKDDVTLEAMIVKQLRSFSSHKIKDMYIELSAFDRHLTGYVSPTQLSLVALRHDLPLKPSLMKLTFQKFADDKSDPNQINYEKFLNFLATCLSKSGVYQAEKHYTPKTAENLRSPPTAPSPVENKSLFVNADERPNMSLNANDDKLTSLLKEQLAGVDDIYFDRLKSTLQAADRLGNGELKADVIQEACVRAQVPLTDSVFTKMLQNAEIAHGVVNWHQFLQPLKQAEQQLNPDHKFEPAHNQHKENLITSPFRSSHKTSPRKSTEKKQRQAELNSAFDTSRIQTAGWDENEPLPRQLHEDTEDEEHSPRRREDWMRNFTRLAHALRSYHPYKNDYLPRREVERMVANYNLIYSLGFSPDRLGDAIARAVTSQSKTPNGQTVSIDRLLEHLSNT
ncbi:uncharacterized protein C1orf87-like isoform X1 [Ciona intestinalis]